VICSIPEFWYDRLPLAACCFKAPLLQSGTRNKGVELVQRLNRIIDKWINKYGAFVDRGKSKYSEKNPFQCFFNHDHYHKKLPDIERQFRSDCCHTPTMEPLIGVFSPMAQQHLVSRDILIVEASRSRSDTPHTIGFLWTRDQSDEEISIWQHTVHTRENIKAAERFEPAFPTNERSQTHALDSAATGINLLGNYTLKPTGCFMYHRFKSQEFHVPPTQYIYVVYMEFRSNSRYLHVQDKLIDFIAETDCVYCAVRIESYV
jgi:hypothetical protein